ncbi:lysylphosphatidylglycerol synthase transmembrane domain-containing protein [Desulforhopalus singaporensis]|uniref:Lysylphosphatidylglycerol synthase TM region n=1 Tax=Desulforhopalus singaporensis TaxID=91360 RepID=A0A1H0QNC2_9BACT|nr:lysylphosphatidylglycerol synthase transmembrane domain-containing protein [Desulforhopalus singaporensis]SDP18236.1 hypothetical protein SAMN05660330_02023 [Desulforhopalus singaporensis]
MRKFAKPFKMLIKVVLSLAFFSVLLSFVKKNELVEIFQQVDWFFFVVSFAVTLIMVAASCVKWRLVLALKKPDIGFCQLFKIYLIGYFFSNILPSTVGGDVVRSYYAGKLIENQSYAAVSVFVERFSGIFFLFMFVTVAPLAQPYLYKNPYIFVPALCSVGFAFITIWVWRAKRPFYLPNLVVENILGLCKWIGRKTGLGVVERIGLGLEKIYTVVIARLKRLREEMQIAVEAVKTDRSFVNRLIGLTLLFYALTWVNVYVCFLAFGVHVDFIKICAIVPAIMLVAHIPVTLLGNLGYFESVFVFYFFLVGVGGAEAFAMGLLLRLKMLAVGVAGYGTYLVYKQKNRLELKKTFGI